LPSRASRRRRQVGSGDPGRCSISPPYALSLFIVGGFGPNENILGLIGFMGKREGDTMYDEAAAIDRRLEQNDHKDRVRLLGFPQNEALVLLYQAAAALLLPSVVEGFGLSAVEAAKCGTHAIVTRMNDDPRVDRQSAV
jgi:glycosyltransferase involved in cell wall biosynthesis